MKTTLPNTGVLIWSAGTDTVARTDFNTAFENLEARVPTILTGARPSPSSARRIHFNATTGRFSYDTGTSWVTIGGNTEDMTAVAPSPGVVPSTIVGAANQTANLTEWKTSTGTVIASIGANGSATFRENILGGAAAGLVTSPAKDRIGHIVSAAIGSVANIAEWRQGTNRVASISPGGALTAFSGIFSDELSALYGDFQAVGAGSVSVTAENNVDALAISGKAGRTLPLITVDSVAGSRIFRLGPTGHLATGKRLHVGEYLNGDSPSTAGTATIFSDSATTPTLALTNVSTQSAPAITSTTGGTATFKVLATGEIQNSGKVVSNGRGTFLGGISNTSSQGTMNGVSSAFELITGTDTGEFTDETVLRHNALNVGVSAKRINRLTFSMGPGNTPYRASIGVEADAGNVSDLKLAGWYGPDKLFQFSNTKQFDVYGNNTIAGNLTFTGQNARQFIRFPETDAGMGQYGTTAYIRYSDTLMFVRGGTHADGASQIGVGGTVTSALYPSGYWIHNSALQAYEFNVGGKTILLDGNLSAYTTTGWQTHDTLALNYGKSGGRVIISNGSGETTLNGRVSVAVLYINGNRLTIGGGAPSGATTGDVWIQV